MDLLDRLLEHDAWTTRQLLLLCETLPAEKLDARFDIGHGTVRATFEHIIANMEIWSALMAGRADRLSRRDEPLERSVPGLLERLDAAASDLAAIARDVAKGNGWNEFWLDVLDEPPVEKTFGGAIGHVITHSMHHRAQLLYMLRQLGFRELPEGDVLSWEKQAKAS